MAKYKISYTSYPSSAEATSYSQSRAMTGFYFGGMINLMIICSVVYYIFCVVGLFDGFDVIDYLKALGIIIVMSWVTLYYYVVRNIITDRECKMIIIREKAEEVGANNDEVKVIETQIRLQSKKHVKTSIKDYFAGLIPALSLGTGLIGCATSVYKLCHKNGSMIGLLISLLIIIGCGIYYTTKYTSKYNVSYHKLRKEKTAVPETLVSKSSNNEQQFCRKCGTRIYPDSLYCSKCGGKIIR